MHVSLESGIHVAEQFLQELFKKYGKYPSPLMAGMVPATMWILSYIIMRIRIMKRASQRELYIIKDRTGIFDDYFPCQK
jgi:hypothetical protein